MATSYQKGLENNKIFIETKMWCRIKRKKALFEPLINAFSDFGEIKTSLLREELFDPVEEIIFCIAHHLYSERVIVALGEPEDTKSVCYSP